MKKLGLLLLLCFTTGVYANYDKSVEIAKRYCIKNAECIDIISLELDTAYEAGQKDGKGKNKSLNTLINVKRKKMQDFCDQAPNIDLCLSYKDELLSLYIKGLAEK